MESKFLFLMSFFLIFTAAAQSEDLKKISDSAFTPNTNIGLLGKIDFEQNNNKPKWNQYSTRSLADSIFIAIPGEILSLNNKAYGAYEVLPGETFYRKGFSEKGDVIYLISDRGIKVAMNINGGPGYATELDYHFWGKSYVNKIKAKYGNTYWADLLKGKVRIGWTKEMCQLSWGKPNEINRTITENNVYEQWVYYGGYLYFTNNKLVTIQN